MVFLEFVFSDNNSTRDKGSVISTYGYPIRAFLRSMENFREKNRKVYVVLICFCKRSLCKMVDKVLQKYCKRNKGSDSLFEKEGCEKNCLP